MYPRHPAIFRAALSRGNGAPKHFTLALLFAVLLCRMAICVWHLSRPGGPLVSWGAMGVRALLRLSTANLFIFAGTSLALTPRVGAWHWRQRPIYLASNLAVLASLGLLLGPIRAQLTGEMLGCWANGFPDASSPARLVYWLGRSHLSLFNYFWQPLGALLLALALLGSVFCWRASRQAELLCLWDSRCG